MLCWGARLEAKAKRHALFALQNDLFELARIFVGRYGGGTPEAEYPLCVLQ